MPHAWAHVPGVTLLGDAAAAGLDRIVGPDPAAAIAFFDELQSPDQVR
ncbi:hypothetical protein Nocox_38785 [Nonomuraea coxensis DSM 45129]|uniref:Uncharacterized protein n=1 Tax=Nonomuraea coxensis DSM 45129 TaxID=1122611 RepID=A0ABX8UC99_9ACTN|nr:hypothetical protein [Nonomuraea coxensis]QYC45307.1 hypothetical protein Nocox_38785 [Nonomuraea coxensis DSM 45129]